MQEIYCLGSMMMLVVIKSINSYVNTSPFTINMTENTVYNVHKLVWYHKDPFLFERPSILDVWENRKDLKWWCEKSMLQGNKKLHRRFRYNIFANVDYTVWDDEMWDYIPAYKMFVPLQFVYSFRLSMIRLRTLRNAMLRFLEWRGDAALRDFLYKPPNGLMFKKSMRELSFTTWPQFDGQFCE